jgi:DNA repair exonuclease SbcCD ATPase subunit
MSDEIYRLFAVLDKLRLTLRNSISMAEEASTYTDKIGGEFQQELGTDLDDIQESLQELLDELDESIEEAKTLRDDFMSMETSLRAGLDDEEEYKVESERIQEEIKQEIEEKQESEEHKESSG